MKCSVSFDAFLKMFFKYIFQIMHQIKIVIKEYLYYIKNRKYLVLYTIHIYTLDQV